MKKYSQEEKYLINESALPKLDELQKGTNRFFTLFPAFKERSYRLFFGGQVISLTGTWLQVVAQGWLVLQLTNSAFMVGVSAAASTLPILFFALFGGVIVDRFHKKNLLLFTQISSMILALTLGSLTLFHIITVQEILILAFALGCINAIDSPARQAFLVEIVDKKDLTSASALNGGMQTVARAIGPGIGGFLIISMGVGNTFMLNAASYITVIIALLFIRPNHQPKINNLHVLKAIHEGLLYSWNHFSIRTFLIIMSVVSIFGWSATAMLPVVAQNILHVNAQGLGYLYGCSGLGAVISAIFISAYGKKTNSLPIVFFGAITTAISLIAFSFAASFFWALVFIFFFGAGTITTISTISGVLQHLVRNDLRGRVMSIYIVTFLGFSPIGNIEIGYLSEKYSVATALRIGGIIIIITIFILLFFIKRIRKEYVYALQAS